MGKIFLDQIKKKGNTVCFSPAFTSDLIQYFSGEDFSITYPFDVTAIPDSILAIPFVCNVLPLIWLTDSELHLKEIDEAFYNSIPEFKMGYIEMYPDAKFKGAVIAQNIIKSDRPAEKGKCAMFYSGGLDSAQTLISHLQEKPDLLSVWGSDIAYNNADGWSLVHKVIKETAERYSLKESVFHSKFRLFDNEWRANKVFFPVLHDGWWYAVKHGIGLLGHVAPYAYLHNISTMYIAATLSPADVGIGCASYPTIDGRVRFAGCQVIHDGFEYNRQDKTHNLVKYCQNAQVAFPLHVCFRSPNGTNCCKCEKCLRTITALISEGADPADYDFEDYEKNLYRTKKIVRPIRNKHLLSFWISIADKLRQNADSLEKRQYWRHIKWMLDVDFSNPETLETFWERAGRKLRKKLSQQSFYPVLRKIKRFILRQSQED